jgi:DNA-binding winged helix-turn-helix (wHTH) protein
MRADGWLQAGDIRVHIARREVLCAGQPVTLPWRAFEALAVLIEAKGAVVERSQMFERLWPGIHVEESSLNHCILQLRRSLGDSIIETVPRVGYRLVPPVQEIAPIEAPPKPWPSFPRSALTTVVLAILALAGGLLIIGGLQRMRRDQQVRELDDEAAHLLRSTRIMDVIQGTERLARAVRLDPASARTHALIAEAMMRSGQGLPGQERSEAETAVRLDPRCGECEAILGWIRCSREWNWLDAERHLTKAVHLDPQFPYAHLWYAQLLAVRGRLPEALDETARAIALDPQTTPW